MGATWTKWVTSMGLAIVSFALPCNECGKLETAPTIRSQRGVCVCRSRFWKLGVEFGEDEGPGGTVSVENTPRQTVPLPSPGERVFVDDVSALQAFAICRTSVDIEDRVMACVMDRRTIEIQTVHERMHQRGAVTCRVCGAKVIAVKEKPWTMDGTCSKACCVTANGATSYSDVEPQLMSLISQDHDPLDLRTQNKAKVEVHCRCGKTFVVRQMYAGTMRTCGHCGTRVQVPG